MVSAIDLVDELEKKGGILNILKDYISKLETLSKKATEIWGKAFPASKRKIEIWEIGRFYGLFKGIYKRVKPDRKNQLKPLLEEYERIYREYKRLTEHIDLSIVNNLIREGERVYKLPKANYRIFLYNLHNWLRKVYLYFTVRKSKLEPIIPDIYKFIDKMIYIIIDVSTEYIGPKNPASFEFILACFIHIENFVHESPEYYEPIGQIPVAIAYLLDVLEHLAAEYEYDVVYPTVHIGRWKDEYYVEPFAESEELEADAIADRVIRQLAAQVGIDIKENISILNYLEQKFPAYFLVYDHLRGVVRREAQALLPWDFLKLSIEDITKYFT